tara:strand:- start:18810 stop:19253 length:444 start_codon:yes stop_codon:yes gene_type:complete
MADFTITVVNKLYAFGPDVTTPSLWGTFQWGGQWLYSSSGLTTETEKLISNSLVPSSAETFDVEKSIFEILLPDDVFTRETDRTISNTLDVVFDTSNEGLLSGDWNYVFTRPSTNAENRTSAIFTEQTSPNTTWASGVATSTSWSDT